MLAALLTVDAVLQEMERRQLALTELSQTATDEGRDLTEDEQQTQATLLAEFEELEETHMPRVTRLEKAMKRDTKSDRSKKPAPAPEFQGAGGDAEPKPRVDVVSPNLQNFTPDLYGSRHEAGQAAYEFGTLCQAFMCQDAAVREKAIEFCKGNSRLGPQMVQVAGTNNVGGFTVPEHVASSVIAVRDRVGLISQLARRYQMVEETDHLNKRAGGLTVEKQGETTATGESNATLARVSLTAEDARTLTYISHKLLRGSAINFADFIVEEIAYAFADQIDAEGINGDGVAGTPYWGITGLVEGIGNGGEVTATGATTYATITSAHLTSLMALVPDRFHRRSNGAGGSMAIGDAGFICSRAVWHEVFERIMQAGGGNTTSTLSSPTGFAYAGYPIYFTDKMPKTYAATQSCILFGSVRDGMVLGERESMSIDFDASFRFNLDQIAIRSRMAYDINFHEAGDGSNPGSVCALVTPA